MGIYEDYFNIVKDTEPSRLLHRWTCTSMIASILGARVQLPFGSGNIYPNMYIMCIGNAGSRKSSAIRLVKKQLVSSGYSYLSVESTSREEFFDTYSGNTTVPNDIRDAVEAELMTQDEIDSGKYKSEYSIIADEWSEFAGVNNISFYTSLGNLWDYRGVFQYRVKKSKTSIINPVLNLLAGCTAEHFNSCFPPETLNQGLPSRMIIVNSGMVKTKIAWPTALDTGDFKFQLKELRKLEGTSVVTNEARDTLTELYEKFVNLGDARLASYSSRRHQHLLKLCMIVAASDFSLTIDYNVVKTANSILCYTESLMPQALGEQGLGKNSSVTGRVYNLIKHANKSINMQELFRSIAQDVKDYKELTEIVAKLLQSERIKLNSNGYVVTTTEESQTDSSYGSHKDFKRLWEYIPNK